MKIRNGNVALTALLLCGSADAKAQPSKDDYPVYRAELYVKVCNKEHAGTGNDVRVQLNGTNSTWLDYARNDFERNDGFTYDLSLDGVGRFGDITRLRIAKTGDDGLCLKTIKLRMNEKVVFSKTYSSGRWLDNAGGHSREVVFDRAALTADPGWTSYTLPASPAITLSNGELESRIESAVGNALRTPGSERVRWGRISGEAVMVYYLSPKKVGVDLDLMAVVDNWADQTVDVDFKLALKCTDGKIEFKVEDLKTDVEMGLPTRVLTSLLSASTALTTAVGGALQGVGGAIAGLAVGLASQSIPSGRTPSGAVSVSGIDVGVCPETLEAVSGDIQGLMPRASIRIAYSPAQILAIARKNGWAQ